MANIVEECVRVYCCHWHSPVRNIKFQKYKLACTFEELREQLGGNETQAWAQYREMMIKKDTHVVSPYQYNETRLHSKNNWPPPPQLGQDYTFKVVKASK